MAAVACSPSSPDAVVDVCMISCSAILSNDDGAYDNTLYPASPALVYHFRASASGQDNLVSPQFTVNSDGTFEWMDVIFPAAGSWTVDLIDEADDGTTATASVTVN